MSIPIFVIGAGGHAKVLVDTLQCAAQQIAGLVDSDPQKHGLAVLGVPIVGADDVIFARPPHSLAVVNGVGSIALPHLREKVFLVYREKGYRFTTVIHPSAIIGAEVSLDEGTQVLAGAVIQPGCRVGRNCIVNTRASIDHDCCIGDHVHIAPGVTMSGDVTVGNGVHIGTGATILQGIVVGDGCLVAAGSVVTRNLPGGSRVCGVPAREIV